MDDYKNVPLTTFGIDGPAEHANIVAARARKEVSTHELGERLLNFRGRSLWRQIVMEPALTDFLDYLDRCLQMPVTTAYRYMDAAYFPQWCSAKYGADKMAELRKIIALTAADETPEEAVALLLPIGEGQTRPFSEATREEVRAARRILKEGAGKVKRELKPEQQAVAEAARQLEAKIEQAAEGWLDPKQVTARRRGDEVVFDLRGVRGSDAWKLFATLASALPPE